MKKILALSMALLILATSVGFTYNAHLCGDIAVSTSLTIGLDHLQCGMEDSVVACENGTTSIHAKSCCNDLHLSIQLDEGAEKKPSISTVKSPEAAIFANTLLIKSMLSTTNVGTHFFYTPPLIDTDFRILYHSFLI